MVNESYDVNEAFRSIEQELISSMMRNLESHKAEETKEGYNWSAWQAEQLKALRQYRQRNKDKYTKEFSLINAQIDGLIKDARKDGQLEQEKKILQAIKSGRLEDKMDSTFEGKFFKTNDRKINSLIKATKKDFKRGETAMLRQADDQYRKIIFNAQMYAASGAGTYEKAVDMATKDFLTRGITSIEYKNGSRHTMEDYSRMCLRTACKRAYFTGEGEMRNSRGQHLVIMIKRGNPCPKCAPWVGKVLIDDVWSGGSREDGDYPLMSEAIAAGLYHPNCLDSHTTYFDDGFDEEYDREHDSDTNVGNMKEEYTKEERQQLAEEYNIEQKAGYAKRQQERFERLEEFSLDPENKRMYGARAQEWQNREFFYTNELQNYNKVIINQEDVKENKRGRELISAHRIVGMKENVYLSDKIKKIKPKGLHNIVTGVRKCVNDIARNKDYNMPTIVIVDENEISTANKIVVASFNAENNVLFISNSLGKNFIRKGVKKESNNLIHQFASDYNPLSTVYHEMYHWLDAQEYIKKYGEIKSQKEYMQYIVKKSKVKVDNLIDRGYNIDNISLYAREMYGIQRYDEVITEFRVKERLG